MRFLWSGILCFVVTKRFTEGFSFWYPILATDKVGSDPQSLQSVQFMGQPFVFYQQGERSILHCDKCPHQGASLSKGHLSRHGTLHCPYHGFEFQEGVFLGIPHEKKRDGRAKEKRIQLPLLNTTRRSDFVYAQHPPSQEIAMDVYFPPEEYNHDFVSVEGSVIISKNYQTICENLLDMLHISYVHSFGNRHFPLPRDIKTQRLSPYSSRTTFHYTPPKQTISQLLGNVNEVVVENEYHLPTNTITRVKAGNVIKTVFTRSVPLSKHQTLLYWKVYRNFWIDPFCKSFTWLGSFLLRWLMKKTIQEDIDILNHVYEDARNGSLIVKYDVTIQNFRRDIEAYLTPF